MNHVRALVFLLCLVSFACSPFCSDDSISAHQEAFPELRGPYLGQEPPGLEPEIFAPGIVSTGLATRDIAITPDGGELYFSVTLGGRWRLRRARSRLWLEPPSNPAGYEKSLVTDGEVTLTIPGWRVRLTRNGDPSDRARWHFTAPATASLQLRTPRPGDTVTINGSEVSVSRLIARHVPRHLRAAWPVLCESARITWIPGVWQGPESGDLLVEVFTDG